MLSEWGLLHPHEARFLADSLDLAAAEFGPPLRVVEIGVFEGKTSRGMYHHLGGHIDYTGIDNNADLQVSPPFPGAKIITGDSAELYPFAPRGIHFLLIDGCHCVNHWMLDFLHYGDLVATNGYVWCHDTDPAMQGLDRQKHGPEHPDYYCAVREGMRLIAPVIATRWELFTDMAPGGRGGAMLFRKRPPME